MSMLFSSAPHVGRRALLRGVGAAVALPWLEAFAPRKASAAAPLRFVGWFHPNGYNADLWTPKTEGTGYALTPTLEPLAPVKDDVLVVSGLTIGTGNVGSHDGGQRALLTATQNIKDGQTDSIDQIIARQHGASTLLPSLQLGLEVNGLYEPFEDQDKDGFIDVTFQFDDTKDYCDVSDCRLAYAKGSRLPNLYNPRLVFEKVFGAGGGVPMSMSPSMPTAADSEAAKRRRALRQSVLDAVKEDARALEQRLGGADRVRLEEYLTGVRQIEKAIAQAEKPLMQGCAPGSKPKGLPMDPMARLRLFCDLVVRAFQCDATRVVTLQLGRGLSPMKFTVDGVTYAHHDASHWVGDDAKRKAKDAIDKTLVAQLAYFLGALKGAGDGESSLLSQSVVYVSSDIADPNKHDHIDMPVLVAGRAGGALKPGRHVKHQGRQTGDLLLSLLAAFGIAQERFGEFGTKPLGGL